MVKRVCIYTLIELLIVISIITILAGLLLPVLSVSRKKAQEIICQGNLKQIGTAILMYANDHNDRIPSVYTWNTDLPDYLVPKTSKKMTVWTCPTAFKQHPYSFTYAMNGDATGWNNPGVKLFSWFREPSKTFLFRDGIWDPSGWYGKSTEYAIAGQTILLHSGGANYLFVDGHVKFFKPSDVTSQMWYK